MRNLIDGGFSGMLLPVNPKYKAIHGHECFGSVSALETGVDLAIFAAPWRSVQLEKPGRGACYPCTPGPYRPPFGSQEPDRRYERASVSGIYLLLIERTQNIFPRATETAVRQGKA
jgi:hypothetical protein